MAAECLSGSAEAVSQIIVDHIIYPIVGHPMRTSSVLAFVLAIVWAMFFVDAQLSMPGSADIVWPFVIGPIWLLSALCFAKQMYSQVADEAPNIRHAYLVIVLFLTTTILLVFGQAQQDWLRWLPFISTLAVWLAGAISKGWPGIVEKMTEGIYATVPQEPDPERGPRGGGHTQEQEQHNVTPTAGESAGQSQFVLSGDDDDDDDDDNDLGSLPPRRS
ncbi:hypothetical protein Slin14017_G035750 [Septoria linicola]|nr:hypothetical protein Slin14017_G035750 [Septoria linicola]